MAKSAFSIDTFHCPKEGLSEDDYEDASCVLETENGYRIAIADGATESSYSKLWASLLVESFVRSEEPLPDFLYKLDDARRVWKEHVSKKKLAWYAEEKAGLGAFAAFLGLSIDPVSRRWEAVAVGDCCLFQLDPGRRGFRLIEAFPLKESRDFGFNPYLVGTSEEKTSEVSQYIRTYSGTIRPDDVFLLASDAVAAWLLKRKELRLPVWGTMSEIDSQEQFEALVESARGDGLHNDDSTLVRLVFRG